MNRNLMLFLCFSIISCVTGKKPPDLTPMASIKDNLTFLFGSSQVCYNKNETPPSSCKAYSGDKIFPTVFVNLDQFEIDIHEVTNEQYDYCVQMGKCTEPEATNLADVTDYSISDQYRKYPIVNVSWKMAQQYCEFAGKRLPTEFEWERVAGGPADSTENKRQYALADVISDIQQCKSKEVAVYYCNENLFPRPVMSSGYDAVTEGGQKIYDLTGNVSEFTADYYKEDVCCKETLPYQCDCFQCKVNDLDCKEKCYTTACEQCWNSADQKPNDDCFRFCVENDFFGFPICIPYGTDEIQNSADKSPKSGDFMVIRGGNYADKLDKTCLLKTTARYRGKKLSVTKDSVYPTLGFRCAKTFK
jgi:formylglycine-generating enzyme required for sulfatase activity